MGLFNKKELQRIEELENVNKKLQETIDTIGAREYLDVKEKIDQLSSQFEDEKRRLIKIFINWNLREKNYMINSKN